MRTRGILLTVLVAILGIFAVANWTTLTAPLPVNLLLLRIEVPVGLVLVGATVVLATVFFLAALFDRAGQLSEIRRLEAQIDTLRAKLDARRLEEIEEVRDAVQAWGSSLEKHVDARAAATETSLLEAIDRSDTRGGERFEALEARVLTVRNELAADVGEVEDAVLRRLDGRSSEGATSQPAALPTGESS